MTSTSLTASGTARRLALTFGHLSHHHHHHHTTARTTSTRRFVSYSTTTTTTATTTNNTNTNTTMSENNSNKLTVYTAGTPNGYTVPIFLEELKVRTIAKLLIADC